MSSSPPPVGSTGTSASFVQVAPVSVDFHRLAPLLLAAYRQLKESTAMFGSAFPVELGRVRFGPKVAPAGGAGGVYAVCPLVCLVNQLTNRVHSDRKSTRLNSSH